MSGLLEYLLTLATAFLIVLPFARRAEVATLPGTLPPRARTWLRIYGAFGVAAATLAYLFGKSLIHGRDIALHGWEAGVALGVLVGVMGLAWMFLRRVLVSLLVGKANLV